MFSLQSNAHTKPYYISKALLTLHTSFFSLYYRHKADFFSPLFLPFFSSFPLFLRGPGGRRGHPWEVSGSTFSLPTFSSHFPASKGAFPLHASAVFLPLLAATITICISVRNMKSWSWEKTNNRFNNEIEILAVVGSRTVHSDAVGKQQISALPPSPCL